MNFSFKSSNAYSLIAVVLTTGLAVAWVADLGVHSGSWPLRIGLLGVAIALAAISVGSLAWRTSRSERSVQRYIRRICELDPHQLANNDVRPELLPSLRRNCSWDDVFNRLRDHLLSHGDRLMEAGNARTAAEVRARRLATEQQQMNEILTGLADPVVAIDQFDELTFANPSACEVLGLDTANTEQRAIKKLLQCETLVGMLTETRRRKGPAQRVSEAEVNLPSGDSCWYEATVRTIGANSETTEEQNDAPQGAVAMLRNISVQKAMQQRHAEFVSAVSHEMKTPLAGIKAYVELLVDGEAEDAETQEEFLDVINGQADRLQRLIDNLLNIARIEAGVVQVDKQAQSLNELLEEAFSVVQPSAETKNIKLERDLSPMYLGVLVDRDMLMQSAINLLSNAIKYTPDGGTVTLRSRTDGEGVMFEVQDTGVGLDEEDSEKVFQKFYRVKKDKNMAAGTGLGLPVAKHITEDVHGGALRVKSEPGKGSTFQISLPLASELS